MKSKFGWYDKVRIIKKDDKFYGKEGIIDAVFRSNKAFSVGIGGYLKVYHEDELERLEKG